METLETVELLIKQNEELMEQIEHLVRENENLLAVINGDFPFEDYHTYYYT